MFGRGTIHGILMSGGMGLLVLGAGWVWAADEAPAAAPLDAEIAAALDSADAAAYEIDLDVDDLTGAIEALGPGGDPTVYDIAPCGGNDTVDVDDIIAILDAFTGIYACTCSGGGLWEANGVNIYNTNTGNVDVGTTITLDPADPAGAGFITLRMLDGGAVLRNTVSIEAEEGGGGGQILLRNETASTRVQIDGDGAEDEGFIQIFNGAGTATILLDGEDATGNGLVQTQRIEVGIGTTVPETRLHVVGGSDVSAASGGYIQTGLATSANIGMDNNEIQARNNGATATLFLNAAGGRISIHGEVPGTEFEIEDNGNVGIGTDAPEANLHVVGVTSIDGLLKIGTTNNSPEAPIDVVGESNLVAIFDRRGSDGTIVSLRNENDEEGTISVSGGTVSYNNFTGSHFGWTDEVLQRGALVVMTGANRAYHGREGGEPIYGVAASATANDSRCLGAYLGILEPQQPVTLDNPHQIMAVGNGEMWVVDSGRNIQPGDFLISSDMTGHAMIDDPERFAVGHVVARAAEPIDWSKVTDAADGRKHKKISVFFESFARGSEQLNQLVQLQVRIASLERQLEAARLATGPFKASMGLALPAVIVIFAVQHLIRKRRWGRSEG